MSAPTDRIEALNAFLAASLATGVIGIRAVKNYPGMIQSMLWLSGGIGMAAITAPRFSLPQAYLMGMTVGTIGMLGPRFFLEDAGPLPDFLTAVLMGGSVCEIVRNAATHQLGWNSMASIGLVVVGAIAHYMDTPMLKQAMPFALVGGASIVAGLHAIQWPVIKVD